MTVSELKKYYRTGYNFQKCTGITACSFSNWLKWGYIPVASQIKLERMTNGDLKADVEYIDK